jgi:hypothetical protein
LAAAYLLDDVRWRTVRCGDRTAFWPAPVAGPGRQRSFACRRRTHSRMAVSLLRLGARPGRNGRRPPRAPSSWPCPRRSSHWSTPTRQSGAWSGAASELPEGRTGLSVTSAGVEGEPGACGTRRRFALLRERPSLSCHEGGGEGGLLPQLQALNAANVNCYAELASSAARPHSCSGPDKGEAATSCAAG